MTEQVDFYVLQSANPMDRDKFTCRLAQKAFRQGHKIFIHTRDDMSARKIDDLLWTFHDTSFVPHALMGEAHAAPIIIGYQDHPEQYDDILINLADEVPTFYDRFKRIIEVVCGEPTIKKLSRAHYRFYQEHDCPLKSHDIKE